MDRDGHPLPGHLGKLAAERLNHSWLKQEMMGWQWVTSAGSYAYHMHLISDR